MKPRFFTSPSEFRVWLREHADSSSELLVGFHKTGSGKKSMTYPEALDQALCFGWIDGVRKRLDDRRYTIRFSPRKPRSIWSRINIAHIARLRKLGLMERRGVEVFDNRDPARSGVYSFENAPRTLSGAALARFRANRPAWAFFRAQPPGYQRVATFYITSAKQEATRVRRLLQVIACSEHEKRLPSIASTPKSGSKRVR